MISNIIYLFNDGNELHAAAVNMGNNGNIIPNYSNSILFVG